jgi:hypothetical protein
MKLPRYGIILVLAAAATIGGSSSALAITRGITPQPVGSCVLH